MSAVNRSETSRALAKAIAYADCGKDVEAAEWAGHLVRLLGAAQILRPDRVDLVRDEIAHPEPTGSRGPR